MNFHSSDIKNISLYKLQMFHFSSSPSFLKEERAGGIPAPSSLSYLLTGCVRSHLPLSPYSIISLPQPASFYEAFIYFSLLSDSAPLDGSSSYSPALTRPNHPLSLFLKAPDNSSSSHTFFPRPHLQLDGVLLHASLVLQHTGPLG